MLSQIDFTFPMISFSLRPSLCLILNNSHEVFCVAKTICESRVL